MTPFSQADYLDVGLDDLRAEAFETSTNSKRVVYEDWRLEKQIIYKSEDSLSPDVLSEKTEEVTSTSNMETVLPSTVTEIIMEGIARYFGARGGLCKRH